MPDSSGLDSEGSRFTARRIAIETTLRGRFNVENVLGAVAAGDLARDRRRRDCARACDGEGRARPVRGDRRGPAFTVIVDYAHTPDRSTSALQAARRARRPATDCRVWRRWRPRPGEAAGDGAVAQERPDRVIVTYDNPRSEDPTRHRPGVLQGAGTDVEIDPDRRSAISRRSPSRSRATSSSWQVRVTSRGRRCRRRTSVRRPSRLLDADEAARTGTASMDVPSRTLWSDRPELVQLASHNACRRTN